MKKERYTQLNVEFQRTAKIDKKASLNKQYRETVKSNRNTRDLFKKTGNIKRKFYGMIGMIKKRNGSGPNRRIC